MATLTLLREGNRLSDPANQLRVLSGGPHRPVEDTLADSGLWPLRATGIRVLQVNQTQVAHCAPAPNRPLTVFLRPDDKMPMVGQNTIRQDHEWVAAGAPQP